MVGYQNDFRSNQSKRITVFIGNTRSVKSRVVLYHSLLFPLWTTKYTHFMDEKLKVNCLILWVRVKSTHCHFQFFETPLCIFKRFFTVELFHFCEIQFYILQTFYARVKLCFTVRFEWTGNYDFFHFCQWLYCVLKPYEFILLRNSVCVLLIITNVIPYVVIPFTHVLRAFEDFGEKVLMVVIIIRRIITLN